MSKASRFRLSLTLALPALLLAPACDGGEKPAPSADAPAAAAAAAASGAAAATGKAAAAAPTGADAKKDQAQKEAPKKEEAAKPKADFSKPPKVDDKAKAKKDAETFNAALAAGRKAVKDKNLPEGMKQFRAALALDPNHPGVLGELGWAAFLAGDLATARAATNQALIYVRSPKRKGALLYNLGRVAEAEKNLEVAKGHYRHSLTLRPNKIVEKRLADLEGKSAGPEAEAAAGITDAGADFAALCKEVKADSLCVIGESDCSCKVHRQGKAQAADATIQEAVVIAVQGTVEGMGEIDEAELWVKTATGGWQMVQMVGDGNVPGVSYIQAHYSVDTLEFAQFFEGGPEELIVEVTQNSTDGTYSDNYMDFENGRTRWLCTSEGSAAQCLVIPLERSWGAEKMLDDGPEPPADVPMFELSWKWLVTPSGKDKLKFFVQEGEDHMEELANILGEQTLEAAGANEGIEQIPLR